MKLTIKYFSTFVSALFLFGCAGNPEKTIIFSDSNTLGVGAANDNTGGFGIILGYSSRQLVSTPILDGADKQISVVGNFGNKSKSNDDVADPMRFVAIGKAAENIANYLSNNSIVLGKAQGNRFSFFEIEDKHYVLDQSSGVVNRVLIDKQGHFDMSQEAGEVGRKK